MKSFHLLSLAATATAFVVPEGQIFNELSRQAPTNVKSSVSDWLGQVKDGVEHAIDSSKNVLDKAFSAVVEAKDNVVDEWDSYQRFADAFFDPTNRALDPPVESFDEDSHPPHHGHPHRPPHHGPRDPSEANLTIYQLISESKYTTKLAKLINEDDDLVHLLNGTAANYTVFAPTDRAFEKIPHHGHKPSKEFIKAVLLYHISPEFYDARRVAFTYTIPTLLNLLTPGEEKLPQRLTVKINLKGLTINYYSRVVATNIYATNGVIHGVDSIIIPPPKALKIISLFPQQFSTLSLGLAKTGLIDVLNSTHHAGGTLFAPSNDAWKRLGVKANAFLFSKYGEKYLRALLKYHVVSNQTLYSDAFYVVEPEAARPGHDGYFHVDLPTLLEDRSLSVDLFRRGPFVFFKINGFVSVGYQDAVAADGVIQVVNSVLIPPKKIGRFEQWNGEELTEQDLIERLEPYVAEHSEF